jgi:hypothetical protein
MFRAIKWTFISLALLFIGSLAVLFWPYEPTLQQDLASVEWLPKAASHISVWERGGFGSARICECTMPEDEFKRFANKEGWSLMEQTKLLAPSTRYLLKLPPLRQIDGQPSDEIGPGLYYTSERNGNGAGITVVYYRDLQRLFVFASSR